MTCGSGLAALVLLAVLGVAVELRRPRPCIDQEVTRCEQR